MASQNVEMNGLENTAGSAPTFFAIRGMTPPTQAAIVQIASNVSPMTKPISKPAISSPNAPQHYPEDCSYPEFPPNDPR